MRVLHIYKTYFPDTQGGVEQVIRNVVRTTTPLGITAGLLTCTANSSSIQHDPFPDLAVTRYPTLINVAQCPMSTTMATHFRKATEWADILHYHFPWPFADLLHLTLAADRPAIVTYHSDVVRQRTLNVLYQPVAKLFLKNVQHIVTGSEALKRSSNLLKNFQNKTSVIPFGIYENDYPKADLQRIQYWQEQLGGPFILFVGVLRYYKGLHILLDALKGTDIRVAIAGDGPCASALREQAKCNNLSQVHFLGAVSEIDKVALMNACHAVVLPSQLRSEAFGIALVEGLMFGKPLISTELGTGTSFVNAHEKTGYVVPANDASALRIAMQRVINDAQRYPEFCAAARERYENLFTADQMGQAYVDCYQRLNKDLLRTTDNG